MAHTVTLISLRAQAREQADMANSSFWSDTRLDEAINRSLRTWWSMVARAEPERYRATGSITATGAASYALPSDHLWTMAVEYQASSTDFLDIPRLQFHERNRFNAGSTSAIAAGYRLVGQTIELKPSPTTGTYRHLYVTTAPVLGDGTGGTVTSFDAVNGWEDWIVFDVAGKMLIKEDSDASQCAISRDALKKEIMAAAWDRELANPRTVQDTRTRKYRRSYDPDFWV